jgi:hypothetical protein
MTTENLEPIEDLQTRGLTRRTPVHGWGSTVQILFARQSPISSWAPVPWMLEATIVLEVILGTLL